MVKQKCRKSEDTTFEESVNNSSVNDVGTRIQGSAVPDQLHFNLPALSNITVTSPSASVSTDDFAVCTELMPAWPKETHMGKRLTDESVCNMSSTRLSVESTDNSVHEKMIDTQHTFSSMKSVDNEPNDISFIDNNFADFDVLKSRVYFKHNDSIKNVSTNKEQIIDEIVNIVADGDLEDNSDRASAECHQQLDDTKKQKRNSLVDENNDSDRVLIHEGEIWVLENDTEAVNYDQNTNNISGTTSPGCSDVNKRIEKSSYSDTLPIGEQQRLYNQQFLTVACRDLQQLLPEHNAQ